MKLSPETQVSTKYGFIFLSLISLSGLQKFTLSQYRISISQGLS